MMRSTDDGATWDPAPSRRDREIDGVDWAALAPYGKIRTLSDGVVIFPVCGQFRGHNNHVSGHLRSYDGGKTWTEFATVASGHVFYNDAIELPDGRMIAIVVNELSPRRPRHGALLLDRVPRLGAHLERAGLHHGSNLRQTPPPSS